jgi:hypothetical protein
MNNYVIFIIIIQRKKHKLINSLNVINNILKIINDNEVEQKKNFKHNPFCYNNIVSINKKDNELHIKYENKMNTIIFSLNEKYRSFSFSNDIKTHIELINIQLKCESNIIKLWIDELKNIENKINNNIELDIYDNYNLSKEDYEINDIIISNEHNNPNIIEYYISVCPIYAFVLEKNKVYIANQYMIKFENNKLNLFYTKKKDFKRLLGRPYLKDLIEKFNKSNKCINANNFNFVINNMQPIFTDMQIINKNGIYDYKLLNIDDNIKITKIK